MIISPRPASSDPPNGGFALLAVMSFLLVVAAASIPFFSSATVQAKTVRNMVQETRERVLLQGLAELAGYYYVLQHATGAAALPERIVCAPSAGLEVHFTFTNHSGLIDLNAAGLDLLVLGFRSLGTDTAVSSTLADDVVANRSADLSIQSSTKESPERVRGGYKHALYESVAELMELDLPHGISFDDLAGVFTTYSRSGTIDRAHTPPRLEATLSTVAESQMIFAVRDTRRLPALSVQAALVRPSGTRTALSAILGLAGDQDVQLLTPPRYLGRTTSSDLDLETGEVFCDEFFPAQAVDIIAEAVS